MAKRDINPTFQHGENRATDRRTEITRRQYKAFHIHVHCTLNDKAVIKVRKLHRFTAEKERHVSQCRNKNLNKMLSYRIETALQGAL